MPVWTVVTEAEERGGVEGCYREGKAGWCLDGCVRKESRGDTSPRVEPGTGEALTRSWSIE